MKQLQALRALRWNYRWVGVWAWLKGRQRCRNCKATGYVLGPSRRHPENPLVTIACPVCRSETKARGYQRILSEPETVITEQTGLADGVFV